MKNGVLLPFEHCAHFLRINILRAWNPKPKSRIVVVKVAWKSPVLPKVTGFRKVAGNFLQLWRSRNPEHLNKRLRPTRDCLRSLSYIILRICLRETYAPSRIAYAWMMWVPPQSKFNLNSIIWKKNVAQLNLTNDQKGRVTIPASMSCAWKSHVAAVSKLSSSNPKKNVVAASVYKPFNVWQKWWVPGTAGSGFDTSTDRVKAERNEATRRPVVQHIDSQQGENRNMASCSTLLRRIIRLKCVNSEIISTRPHFA